MNACFFLNLMFNSGAILLKFKFNAGNPNAGSPRPTSKIPFVTVMLVADGDDTGHNCVPPLNESQMENLKLKLAPEDPPSKLPLASSNLPWKLIILGTAACAVPTPMPDKI